MKRKVKVRALKKVTNIYIHIYTYVYIHSMRLQDCDKEWRRGKNWIGLQVIILDKFTLPLFMINCVLFLLNERKEGERERKKKREE